MSVTAKKKTKVTDSIVFAILSLGSITMLFPLFWMISTSLKDSQHVFKIPPQWIPDPINWSKYIEVWKVTPLLKGIGNSMTIAVTVIIVGIFASSLGAYSFSKLRFPYKNQLFMALLGTMMIPYAVILIPQFVAFSKIGWFDSLLPLIVPGLFGNVGVLFFLRQYMNGIPNELVEAAKIDGCGYFGIYAKIIMPLSKPALAAQVIFMFMGIWNDFFGPIVYINTPEKMTIQAMIRNFSTLYQSQTDFPMIMAASLISMAPILILFVAFQKYFVESLAISGIKG